MRIFPHTEKEVLDIRSDGDWRIVTVWFIYFSWFGTVRSGDVVKYYSPNANWDHRRYGRFIWRTADGRRALSNNLSCWLDNKVVTWDNEQLVKEYRAKIAEVAHGLP